MIVSVNEFLRTVRLGTIGLGTSAADVRALLGEPWKSTEDLPVQIWQYGDLELNVQDGLIVMLMLIVDSEPVNLPNEFRVDDLREWSGRPMHQIEDWLMSAGLAIEKRIPLSESESWVLSTGVDITFMNGAVDSIGAIARVLGGLPSRE